MKETILFEQNGPSIFEGRLFCEICGYKSNKSTLDVFLAHKKGYHNIK